LPYGLIQPILLVNSLVFSLTAIIKEEYIVYTLHQINRQKAESEIASFAKNISARYTAALSQWGTLKAALEGYAFIVKALQQNLLHRIMAYYDTPAGRAGLYEYVILQINELANSLSVEAIPMRTIQETENLVTRINLRSSKMPLTGLLDCQAVIYGMEGGGVTYPFNSASENPYNLQIRNMKPGAYNVAINILLSKNFEQRFQRNGLTDADTIFELGKALNASHVIAGYITRLGNNNLFLVSIMDD